MTKYRFKTIDEGIAKTLHWSMETMSHMVGKDLSNDISDRLINMYSGRYDCHSGDWYLTREMITLNNPPESVSSLLDNLDLESLINGVDKVLLEDGCDAPDFIEQPTMDSSPFHLPSDKHMILITKHNIYTSDPNKRLCETYKVVRDTDDLFKLYNKDRDIEYEKFEEIFDDGECILLASMDEETFKCDDFVEDFDSYYRAALREHAKRFDYDPISDDPDNQLPLPIEEIAVQHQDVKPKRKGLFKF